MVLPVRRPWSVLRNLLRHEASGGLILIASAAAAMAVANSPLNATYGDWLAFKIAGLDVKHWINDGLMTLFFVLVGLEIKREMIDGHLSSWHHRILPAIAAVGGMLVPAVIYLAVNAPSPAGAPRGWAIATATDIAFSLGVLALLGRRAPGPLRLFLLALAIIDDIGAIVIIALFYTSSVSVLMLGLAALTAAALAALNRAGVERLAVYVPLGLLLWFLMLQSGVHATVGGVVFALTVPLRRSLAHPDDAASPLHRLENMIEGSVAFLVIPVFGFANAGVTLSAFDADKLVSPVVLGIAGGLFFGKQVGVFGFVWLAVRMGLVRRPGVTWLQLYGVALLCGIGFTMSLFIGILAFGADAARLDETKLGVMAGSLLSALAGWAVLRAAPLPQPRERRPE